MSKILYAASTVSHINSFHKPYIEALRAEGHQVFVMAKGEGADFDIPFRKKMLSRENRECRKQIRQIVDRERFDIIILNTSLAAFHIRLALGKCRPKVLNIVHGYLFSKKSRGIKKKAKSLLLLLAEKLLRGRVDCILTMNSEDYLLAKKHRLAPRVENSKGMGVMPRTVGKTPSEIRAEMSSSAFALLFVGELSGRKNQRFLIESMPDIRKEIPNAELWLVGDGDAEGELKDLAASLSLTDSVKFLGRRQNPQDYMNAADLYVSASEIEGLPFNVAEAMSLGCTCLLSRIKGHEDLAAKDAAYLYTPGSREEFCRAVADIYEGRLPRLSEAAKDAFLEFSYGSVFEKTYGAIKDLCDI